MSIPRKDEDTLARVRRILILVGLIYGLVYALMLYPDKSFELKSGKPLASSDFWAFYSMAHMVRVAGPDAVYDVKAYHDYQRELGGEDAPVYVLPYPPHAFWLLAPLSRLSYFGAYVAFNIVSLLLFLWAAGARQSAKTEQVLLLAAAPATLVTLIIGQNGLFTSALLLGGVRLMAFAPIRAGILFGILTVKPQLGLMIPIAVLARRNWRCFFSAALTTAVLVGLTTLSFGTEIWSSYLAFAPQFTKAGLEQTGGTFMRAFCAVLPALRVLGLSPSMAALVQLVVTIGTTIIVFRTFSDERTEEWRTPLLIGAAFLAPPYVGFYDLPALAAAAAFASVKMAKDGFQPFEQLVLLAVWAEPILAIIGNDVRWPVAPLVTLAFVWIVWRRVASRTAMGS